MEFGFTTLLKIFSLKNLLWSSPEPTFGLPDPSVLSSYLFLLSRNSASEFLGLAWASPVTYLSDSCHSPFSSFLPFLCPSTSSSSSPSSPLPVSHSLASNGKMKKTKQNKTGKPEVYGRKYIFIEQPPLQLSWSASWSFNPYFMIFSPLTHTYVYTQTWFLAALSWRLIYCEANDIELSGPLAYTRLWAGLQSRVSYGHIFSKMCKR